MRKRFELSVLTMSVGLVFVSAADIPQTAFAQSRLPPGDVSILNQTATNNSNKTISNSTNSKTETVKSMKPLMKISFLAKNRIRIRRKF
jgi:hypothetical protein